MSNSTKISLFRRTELADLVGSHLSGGADADVTDTDTELLVQAYSDICIRLLKKCKMTRATACAVGNFYMMSRTTPTAAVMLIDKHRRIKSIVLFATNYKARLSEFSEELLCICKNAKVKKCIVIFNYRYKDTQYRELVDINRLYKALDAGGIRLLDAISFADGRIYSPIYAITKTYDR